MQVVVRGGGLAAGCCAHLLRSAGLAIRAEKSERNGVPALMVSARTQRLIGDVLHRDDLFQGLPRVEARIVAWGADGPPRRLPHSAVVVSERELLERLSGSNSGITNVFENNPAFTRGAEATRLGAETTWTVYACRPFPSAMAEQRFGSRMASAFAVELAPRAEASACWVESVSGGWLFLLPGRAKTGWLLAVGTSVDSLLAESRVVAPQIQSLGRAAGQFPAYPGIAFPLCGPGWLACGSAAVAFDPLCGDGTGNAIREAILAAAVIRAIRNGARQEDVLEHYRARLLAGFERHLQLCLDFYTAGRSGPWWDGEREQLRAGLEFCKGELQRGSPFRYRLQGYELQPL